MKRSLIALFVLIMLACACPAAFGQRTDSNKEIIPQRNYQPLKAADSVALRSILDSAISDALKNSTTAIYKDTELSAALIDLSDPSRIVRADHNGELRLYPASVVKLFYLAALERQIEDDKVTITPELTRGVHDMIVDSSNEATQYILDVLTGTSSGAELPPKEFDLWQYKRNRVNRYFTAMGYTEINVNQKTFCEDAYGIEQQSRNYKGENRNMLTADATARLLAEIVLGRIANPDRTSQMLTLLRRDPFAKGDAEDQAHGFTGRLFIERKMSEAKLWSKAGWTSKSLHDGAYIETADGLKFVLVIFTDSHANERGVIPAIAGNVIDGLRKLKK